MLCIPPLKLLLEKKTKKIILVEKLRQESWSETQLSLLRKAFTVDTKTWRANQITCCILKNTVIAILNTNGLD